MTMSASVVHHKECQKPSIARKKLPLTHPDQFPLVTRVSSVSEFSE